MKRVQAYAIGYGLHGYTVYCIGDSRIVFTSDNKWECVAEAQRLNELPQVVRPASNNDRMTSARYWAGHAFGSPTKWR